MKKLLAVILSLTLAVSMSAMFVSATDVVDPEGYEFDILAVDTTITAEKGLILTSAEALAASGTKNSIVIHCEKVGNNVYKVKEDTVKSTDTQLSFTFKEGDIVIAIHSSSSAIADKGTYANVEQKLAALSVKSGMYFELVGIDLTTKTATEGKAICTAAKPDATAESVTSEEPVVSDTSSVVSSEESITTSKDESKNATSSNDNNESKITTNDKKGFDTTTYIIIGVAAVAVIAAIGFIIMKKKK